MLWGGRMSLDAFRRTALAWGLCEDASRDRGWGERFGRITKDEEIDGLGDEAWLLRTETGGTEVIYHWRRGNLVVEAHVTVSGSAQATSMPLHVPGSTLSTRPREQARSREFNQGS